MPAVIARGDLLEVLLVALGLEIEVHLRALERIEVALDVRRVAVRAEHEAATHVLLAATSAHANGGLWDRDQSFAADAGRSF